MHGIQISITPQFVCSCCHQKSIWESRDECCLALAVSILTCSGISLCRRRAPALCNTCKTDLQGIKIPGFQANVNSKLVVWLWCWGLPKTLQMSSKLSAAPAHNSLSAGRDVPGLHINNSINGNNWTASYSANQVCCECMGWLSGRETFWRSASMSHASWLAPPTMMMLFSPACTVEIGKQQWFQPYLCKIWIEFSEEGEIVNWPSATWKSTKFGYRACA